MRTTPPLSVASCEPWIDWTSSPAMHHGFGIRMADEQRVKVFIHPIVLTEHVFDTVRWTQDFRRRQS
jgi:hypothetical protein